MNKNLGLTGLILCSTLSCSLETIREADALGTVESTYCVGKDTYKLDLENVSIQFSDSCEFLYRENLILNQNTGNVDCKNVDYVQPECGVIINGFYDESGNIFYSENIMQISPEIKQIWPLKESNHE